MFSRNRFRSTTLRTYHKRDHMHARGLFIVGTFNGSEPVTKSGGEVVPGFNRVNVLVSADGADPWNRDATYNTVDRDTGEASPFATQLAAAGLKVGDPCVVKVKTKTQSGSGFVNLEAVGIAPLAALLGAK